MVKWATSKFIKEMRGEWYEGSGANDVDETLVFLRFEILGLWPWIQYPF